jgi:hypothetical protein
MNRYKNVKIDNLIGRMSIDNRCNQVMSADDFKTLEQRLSIKIPHDYQYFCQTLGSGRLAMFLDIYCLVDELILEGKRLTKHMIDRIHEYLIIRSANIEEYNKFYKDRDDDSYVKLLESALIFGIYNGETAFFWDLRTYDPEDDSYDIQHFPVIYSTVMVDR